MELKFRKIFLIKILTFFNALKKNKNKKIILNNIKLSLLINCKKKINLINYLSLLFSKNFKLKNRLKVVKYFKKII